AQHFVLLSGRGGESVRPLTLFEYLLWAARRTPEERAQRLAAQNRPCYTMRSAMRLAVAFALLLALTASVRAQQTGPAVQLAWDPPLDATGRVYPGLTGYQLQRCTVPAGQSSCTPQDLPQAMPATQTSYRDTEVTRGGRYIYTVVALCPGCQ